jgi:ribose 5-phosphate isomerase B
MLYIASDHGGFEVKKYLIEYFTTLHWEFSDEGAHEFVTGDDYPIYAKKVCEKMQESDKAILICDTGIGMSIEANRFHHIRAALCTSVFEATRARAHNDANVLVIGSETNDIENIKAMVKVFFSTNFSGEERHIRRISELT